MIALVFFPSKLTDLTQLRRRAVGLGCAMKRALIFRLLIFAALCCECSVRHPSLAQTSDNLGYLSPTHRFAVLIGVSEFDDSRNPRLLGPSNDTQALRNALIQNANFLEENVLTITSRSATRLNILQSINSLIKRAPEDSLIFVAYSGYGFAKDDQLYIVPYDGVASSLVDETAISLGLLDSIVSSRDSIRTVFVFDTSFNHLESSPGSAPFGNNSLANNLSKTSARRAVYLPSDASYEDPGQRQGLFTQAVVNGIQGGAKDQNGDVTTAGLAAYLDRTLSQVSATKRGLATHLQYSLSSTDFVIAHPVEPKLDDSSISYFVRTSIRPLVELPEPLTQIFRVDDKGECTLHQTRTATFCIDGDAISKIGEFHTSAASCDSKPLGSSVNGRCLTVDYALHGCEDQPSCSYARLSFDFPVQGVRYATKFLDAFTPPRAKVSASITSPAFQYPGVIPSDARNIQWTYTAEVLRISADNVIGDVLVTNVNPKSSGVKSSISGDGRLVIDVSDLLGAWSNDRQ
jgi:Caspase domain